jgi:hypothetical protein
VSRPAIRSAFRSAIRAVGLGSGGGGEAPPKPYPLSLFKPGDRGGFYNPNVIGSLFQTRTGPTVPVTANNDPVQYIVDQNGQFDLSRALTAQGMIYFDGLLGMPPSGTQALLTSGNVPGFEQCTIVVGGAIEVLTPPIASNIWGLQFDVDNTTAFGGGFVRLDVRASPRVFLSTWVPPDQNPSFSLNIPDTSFDEAFTFGARFDTNSATQYVFFNDVDASPTLAYSPVTSGASAAEFGGVGDDANNVVSIASFAFFIDRWLSDAELAELKQWMIDNAGQPV